MHLPHRGTWNSILFGKFWCLEFRIFSCFLIPFLRSLFSYLSKKPGQILYIDYCYSMLYFRLTLGIQLKFCWNVVPVRPISLISLRNCNMIPLCPFPYYFRFVSLFICLFICLLFVLFLFLFWISDPLSPNALQHCLLITLKLKVCILPIGYSLLLPWIQTSLSLKPEIVFN